MDTSIDHILAHGGGQQINSSCDSAILTHELQLNEMIFSGIKPMALKAAVLLNIPDIIATKGNGGPLSVEQIASHIADANSSSTYSNSHHVDVGYLYRILRFLGSYGVFTEQVVEEADQADQLDGHFESCSHLVRLSCSWQLTKSTRRLINICRNLSWRAATHSTKLLV